VANTKAFYHRTARYAESVENGPLSGFWDA
jgi:hypothetical protein